MTQTKEMSADIAPTLRFKPYKVSIDCTCDKHYAIKYDAITDGTLWNGWECPLFDLENAKKVLSDMIKVGINLEYVIETGGSYYELNEDETAIIETYYDTDGNSEVFPDDEALLVNGVRYFSIGWANWTWYEAMDAYPEEAE